MRIQEARAGACSDVSFLFGAHFFLFHFKDISPRTQGKAHPSRPLLPNTPQCRRNGAQFVISALMWERRRRGFVPAFRIEQSEGRIGIPPDVLHAEEVARGILLGDGSGISGGVYYML